MVCFTPEWFVVHVYIADVSSVRPSLEQFDIRNFEIYNH